MSQIATSTWSEVAASNNATPPGGWPEGQAPSTVNDCAREMMSALKIDWNQRNPTVTSGGAANVQTLTYATAPAAYVQGLSFSFIAGFTNTGTATLNVNALGAKNIFMDGAALAGNEIVAGSVVQVMYDGTRFHIASSRAPASAPYGFKNVIINGDFPVQQRGAGGALSVSVPASTAGAYTFDRWCLSTGANQACTVVAGASSFAPQSRYVASISRTSGQTGLGQLQFQAPLTTDQLAAIQGRIVTLQFKAVGSTTWVANNGNLACTFFVGTGTEGKRGAGFTTETSPCAVSTAVTTSGVFVTVTSSAVVPTTATQGCIMFTWTPTATAGVSESLILAEVQLEAGGVATSFDRRPFDVELARCQRFYQKSFPYATAPAQNTGLNGTILWRAITAAATGSGTSVPFQTRMRTTPGTITFYNPSAANAQARDTTAGADCSSTSAGASSNDMYIALSTVGNASSVVNSVMAAQWSADADLT